MFPPPDPDSAEGEHAAEAARALLPLLEEMRPHVVVSDILTLAPSLAAEKAGVPLATLIPHMYPVVEPGLPFFAIGLKPPRTPLGRAVWRTGQRALNIGLEHGRRDLNRQRERLDLPPVERFHGGISTELALVGTFPQLEYPRQWPAGVEITGPMSFEIPHPDIQLRPERQELGEVVVEDQPVEQTRRPRPGGPARPAEPAELLVADRAVERRIERPASASATPRVRHCQSCEREISAVAASSIRLLIAAAPLPRSHASRYGSATHTFAADPRLGHRAARHAQVEQLCRATSTLLAQPLLLVRPVAEDAVEDLHRDRARGRDGRPRSRRSRRPLSRSLSSRTFAIATSFTAGSRRFGMNAAIPPIACAPRRWQVRTSSSV